MPQGCTLVDSSTNTLRFEGSLGEIMKFTFKSVDGKWTHEKHPFDEGSLSELDYSHTTLNKNQVLTWRYVNYLVDDTHKRPFVDCDLYFTTSKKMMAFWYLEKHLDQVKSDSHKEDLYAAIDIAEMAKLLA